MDKNEKTIHFYYRYEDPEKDKCDILNDCSCNNRGGPGSLEEHNNALIDRGIAVSLINGKLYILCKLIDIANPKYDPLSDPLYRDYIRDGHDKDFSRFSTILHMYWDPDNILISATYNSVKDNINDLYSRIIYGLYNHDNIIDNGIHFDVYDDKIICIETDQAYKCDNKTIPVKTELDKIFYSLFLNKIA